MGLLRTDYAELFLYDPYGFGNCDFMKGDRHVCSRSINVLGYLINLFVQSQYSSDESVKRENNMMDKFANMSLKNPAGEDTNSRKREF